jgi:tRNA threonylcarbamoyladenosine biosynthesis protein TsaB
MTQIGMHLQRALAIETSGRNGSVALVDAGRVLAEESFPHGLKHAAGLLPLIDQLMHQHRWEPADLQELYVSEGPGSFTGLRIGVTLAKTLSLATGARIVPVPSLQVLARNAPPQARHVIVVLDAKRDQIFTARYERDDQHWLEHEQAHLDSLPAVLSRSPRPVYLIGEGVPFHKQFLPIDSTDIQITDESCWRARATVVAQLGIELSHRGMWVDADRFVPAYVRKPEAEEKYERSHA